MGKILRDGGVGGATQKTTLTFWSGVGTVTGANFMLERGGVGGSGSGAKILIDCGLVQGVPGAGDQNRKPFPYDPVSVGVLFVTHAHIDHIGRIPKLVKDGFRGVIYSTRETKALSVFMFEDALKLFHEEPLYEKTHVEAALALWKEIPYREKFECAPGLNGAPGLSAELLDAGHILGSAMIKISGDGGKNILFTGDSGNSPAPIIKDTEMVTGINYLVLDSVYGDRNHEPKDEREKHFEKIVREAIERKGTLVIPAFSLDRTQIILYELNNLIEQGKIPSVPVFLDSPLAIKLTAVYKNSSKYFNKAVQNEIREGDDIFNFPRLKTFFAPDRSHIIDKTASPKIIIAGSGMSSGGRVMGHEMKYLPEANSTILLTGYQSLGTVGRMLEEGAREVLINGEKIVVRARIEMISGFSAHKDSAGLLDFVEHTRESLEKVFVVMGEPRASLFLTQRIRDYLDMPALYPEVGKGYELDM